MGVYCCKILKMKYTIASSAYKKKKKTPGSTYAQKDTTKPFCFSVYVMML
jgi:hypothetical protein